MISVGEISSETRVFGLDTYSGGGDMGKVGGNTRSVDDIVEGKLVDEGGELEEEGQRLNSE